jgi:hypothetical protein
MLFTVGVIVISFDNCESSAYVSPRSAHAAGRRPANDRWSGGVLTPRGRLARVLLALASAVLVALTATLLVGVPSARADTVWSWGNPVLMVITGGKNYSNHTQWVSSITIEDAGSQVCDGGTYEAWAGSVWYASRVPCSPQYGGTMNTTTFYVNRWVSTGSGVCGSFWRWYSRGGWLRLVSCITIRV